MFLFLERIKESYRCLGALQPSRYRKIKAPLRMDEEDLLSLFASYVHQN